MSFMWPQMLILLVLVPLLVLGYVMLLRRRKKHALRYASLAIVREAMGPAQQVRRHIPPFFFLLSLIAMLLAVARPTTVVTLPSQHDTIILAIDVSGSMRAQDVEPNRLEAALAAVKKFVKDQPSATRIGIVAFAGTATVAQAPTLVREDLLSALDRFQLQRGTAVGSGLLVALKMIFPDLDFDLESANPRPDNSLRRSMRDGARGLSLNDASKPPPQQQEFRPVPPGSYKSAAIILLTDGQATTGPDPIESAKMAAERGVRVFTVGIGTVDGEIIGVEGWSMRVRLDEETLKKIADVTAAEYFYAGTAQDISKVYKTLNSKLVLETKATEITALFAAVAALFAILAGGLSMLWFNRVL